jgi:hypothetical protein
MQWHLNRVCALSGVSEAAELEDDTDEEAEGTNGDGRVRVQAQAVLLGPAIPGGVGCGSGGSVTGVRLSGLVIWEERPESRVLCYGDDSIRC